MITLRPSAERGLADHGWLNSRHTFSFAEYHDPAQMGYSALRVINEDRVAPGQGFGRHPHRDMEIISIVLDGELEHQDSMGNETRIKPGEVQRMSAGTGVLHSEFNPLADKPVHFLQIWILPRHAGSPPSYDQKAFPRTERAGILKKVVSPDGSDGTIAIDQDASLYLGNLRPGHVVTHALAPGRRAYVQLVEGRVRLDGQVLEAGDGARVELQDALRLEAEADAEVLLFDLP